MEGTASGEINIMSPTRRISGFQNLEIIRGFSELGGGRRQRIGFDSSTGLTLPDGSVMSPDAA